MKALYRLSDERRVVVVLKHAAQTIRDCRAAGVTVAEAKAHGAAVIVERDEVVPFTTSNVELIAVCFGPDLPHLL
jgi:hypothetical protein